MLLNKLTVINDNLVPFGEDIRGKNLKYFDIIIGNKLWKKLEINCGKNRDSQK